MSTEPLDLATVIADIRRTAEAHTASGMYEAGFEEDLRSHFARLLDRVDGRDRFNSVHAAIERFGNDRGFARSRIETTSGVPGGEALHKAIGKVVSRQVDGLVEQLNQFSASLMPVLQQLGGAVSDPPAHTHADVFHELDTVQERLAAVERAASRADAMVQHLETAVPRVLAHLSDLDGLSARIARLEELERRRGYDPLFSSTAFADAARGDADSLRAEYVALADVFVGARGRVLDIGAGRGEFLGLLRERDVEAYGVEVDPELVSSARAAGLDVRLQDGLDALRDLAPGSLGGAVLLHVIEHLHPNELLELLALAHDRLFTGGKLVLETPNPQTLYVYARAFWLDPTHTKPVHPIFLDFALRQAGFSDVQFEWTAFPPEAERLVEIPVDTPAADSLNANVQRLNELIYGAQNYRIIATR